MIKKGQDIAICWIFNEAGPGEQRDAGNWGRTGSLFQDAEGFFVMLENEGLVKKVAKAGEDARVIFPTGFEIAAMEVAVINLFVTKAKLLVVNGGVFSQRFADLYQIHSIEALSGHELDIEKALKCQSTM